MAQKVYIKDDNLGLGCFSFPILSFNERMETVKGTNPQLDEQARAALVYFGMLAQQPKPTRESEVYVIDWENVSPYKSGELVPVEEWLEREESAKYSALGRVLAPIVKEDPQTAYFKALKNLQDWLVYYKLNNGIEKTLREESRKIQASKAQAQEAKAAAARALAYTKMNAEQIATSEDEYLKAIEKNQKQYDEAVIKEAEYDQMLENVRSGLPADFGETKESGGMTILKIAALGAGAFFLLRG